MMSPQRKRTIGLSGLTAILLAQAALGQTAENASGQPAVPGATVQSADAAAKSDQAPEEIVVTGTLIRGVAPAGAQVIGLSSTDVVATGALSTNQVLATVPQIGNLFNELPQIQ